MPSSNLLLRNLGKSMSRNDGVGMIISGETGEGSSFELETLSVPKSLVRSVSQKLMLKKKKNNKSCLVDYETNEGVNEMKVSSGCLGLHVKGGGCKVGSCEEVDFSSCKGKSGSRGRSGSMEECMPHRAISRIERNGLECFSHSMTDRFWKKNLRKEKEAEILTTSVLVEISVPDDVLEMCLIRLPLVALMNARLVCKKWRDLTTTPHFMQMRSGSSHRTPWLFLFGAMKDDCYAGEIHALDVSLDCWYRINADVLKGRFLFSVTSIGTDLFVVGGCSRLTRYDAFGENSYLETHKGVLVLNSLTGSWCKAAPMRSARLAPILGVFEVSSNCSVFHRLFDHQRNQDRRVLRSRINGVSDVYEDPHRFSRRRQLSDAFNDRDILSDATRKLSKFARQEKSDKPKFVLIAVGGRGSWDEHLDSGEIYDPMTNRWIEIAKLPDEFGTACSGTVCNGTFYVYSTSDKIAGYDLERETWIVIQTSQPPSRLQEYYPILVSCKDRLFMLSVSWCEREGQRSRREKAVRKLWELDLSFLAWSEVSRHPDAPMDWNASFTADTHRIYGVEMFKIFGQELEFLTVYNVSEKDSKWSRISRNQTVLQAGDSLSSSKPMAVLQL